MINQGQVETERRVWGPFDPLKVERVNIVNFALAKLYPNYSFP